MIMKAAYYTLRCCAKSNINLYLALLCEEMAFYDDLALQDC